MDAGILYYRRDLLDRYGLTPPATWPDLVRSAQIILERERNPALTGFVWQGKQYEGLVSVAHEFVWGHGANLIDDPTPDAEEAVGFMRALVGHEAVSPPSVATGDEETTRHLFGAGRAIFMRNWTYSWTLLNREGSPVRGKIGVAPLPAFQGHESVSVLGGWLLAVPRGAAHPVEAKALMAFLASTEVQRRMAMELGYQPVRMSLYQDRQLLRNQPWWRNLFPVLHAARPRPVTPYYLMLSQVLQPELSAAVVGTKSPHDALVSARRHMAMIPGFDARAEAP
jgi:multiple sugar transport system substrate-binding protein